MDRLRRAFGLSLLIAVAFGGGPAAADGLNIGTSWAQCVVNPSSDADQNGLDDACELALATAFQPQLVFGMRENASQRFSHWASTTLSYRQVRIFYALSYFKDAGIWQLRGNPDAHLGDSEFVVLDIINDGTSTWMVNDAVLSVHFNTVADDTHPYSYDKLQYVNGMPYRSRPVIWVSEGKHSNYPDSATCNSALVTSCNDKWREDTFPSTLQGRNLGLAGQGQELLDEVPLSGNHEWYWTQTIPPANKAPTLFCGWQLADGVGRQGLPAIPLPLVTYCAPAPDSYPNELDDYQMLWGPPHQGLCDPCSQDSDCLNGGLCLVDIDGSRVCGRECEGIACPTGTECDVLQSGATQCRPTGGLSCARLLASNGGNSPACYPWGGPQEQAANLHTCTVDMQRPQGYQVAQPWFEAIQQGAANQPSTVQIAQLRLVVSIGGKIEILEAPSSPPYGVAGLGEYSRNPWFPPGESPSPVNYTAGASISFNPSDYASGVVHGWNLRSILPPPGGYDDIWVEALVKITGPAAVQIGFDFWQAPNAYFSAETPNPVAQGAVSSWYGPGCSAQWITIASARNPTPQAACTAVEVTPATNGCVCTDADGDGYGVPSCNALQCAGGNDCNDKNAKVNPGYPEICKNGLDDNCNGVIDEMPCVPPALSVKLRAVNAASLPGWVCAVIMSQNNLGVPLVASGPDLIGSFDFFAPGNLEIVAMLQDAPNCGGNWIADLFPASLEVEVNGTRLANCSARTGNANWRSLRAHVDSMGNATDIGEIASCPLTVASAGHGIPVVVQGYSPAVGDALCLSFLQPGVADFEMSPTMGGALEGSVYLVAPTSGEFIIYESVKDPQNSQNDCNSWVKDIRPAMGQQILVGGTPINSCTPRSTNPMWLSMSFRLAANDQVTDLGVKACQ